MFAPRFLVGLVRIAGVVSACVPYQTQHAGGTGYGSAAVFAATAVGATVAKRQLDGGCYAQCSPGYFCDEKSGLCEPLDCGCGRGEICERRGADYTCATPLPPSATAGPPPSVTAGPPPSVTAGPPPSAAPAAGAAASDPDLTGAGGAG